MPVSVFFRTTWRYLMVNLTEGINKKMQLAKQQARGYHNIANFMNMFYLIAVGHTLR